MSRTELTKTLAEFTVCYVLSAEHEITEKPLNSEWIYRYNLLFPGQLIKRNGLGRAYD